MLHRSDLRQHQHNPACAGEPCAQLEFQSRTLFWVKKRVAKHKRQRNTPVPEKNRGGRGWKKDLQICGVGAESRARRKLVVGKRPNGKYLFIRVNQSGGSSDEQYPTNRIEHSKTHHRAVAGRRHDCFGANFYPAAHFHQQRRVVSCGFADPVECHALRHDRRACVQDEHQWQRLFQPALLRRPPGATGAVRMRR